MRKPLPPKHHVSVESEKGVQVYFRFASTCGAPLLFSLVPVQVQVLSAKSFSNSSASYFVRGIVSGPTKISCSLNGRRHLKTERNKMRKTSFKNKLIYFPRLLLPREVVAFGWIRLITSQSLYFFLVL